MCGREEHTNKQTKQIIDDNNSLTGNGIGKESVKIVSEMLKVNTTLRELNISGYYGKKKTNIGEKRTKTTKRRTENIIGEEGAKTLCETLEINTTLTSLNLRGNEKKK